MSGGLYDDMSTTTDDDDDDDDGGGGTNSPRSCVGIYRRPTLSLRVVLCLLTSQTLSIIPRQQLSARNWLRRSDASKLGS